MRVSAIIAIVVLVGGGLFFYATVLQPQLEIVPPAPPAQPPAPPTQPPSVETNGHAKPLETETTTEPSGDLSLPDLFQRVENSVVQITLLADPTAPIEGDLGSGFVYDKDGHIITNNHVVEFAGRISVTFLDGTVYKASRVGTDPYTDLAVIKVDVPAEKLQPLPLGDSSQLMVGQQVVAIGNPFGLSGSMTSGIVSQLGRLLEAQGALGFSIPDVIQTDAAINPGNSGGPLLNLRGEVVGVNSAIRSATGEFTGVGFAIPSNTVKKIVPTLINEGTYRHPWLGVTGRDITPEIAEIIGLEEARGFLVVDIVANSPAEQYDVRGGTKQVVIDGRQIRIGGDVIVGIDDIPVRKIDDILVYLQRAKAVGDEITLHVLRDGQPTDVKVVLGERPSPSESP